MGIPEGTVFVRKGDGLSATVSSFPAKSERHKVVDALRIASEQDFDEVVILGFKDGKSYLNHSKIDDTPRLVGAIEWIKHRLMEDRNDE